MLAGVAQQPGRGAGAGGHGGLGHRPGGIRRVRDAEQDLEGGGVALVQRRQQVGLQAGLGAMQRLQHRGRQGRGGQRPLSAEAPDRARRQHRRRRAGQGQQPGEAAEHEGRINHAAPGMPVARLRRHALG